MDYEVLTLSHGEIVDIGVFEIIPSEEFSYRIPLIPFLVIKAVDGFVSNCIKLHMDGYGKTAYKAKKNMYENCTSYLIGIFYKPKMSGKSWAWLGNYLNWMNEPLNFQNN